MARHFVRGLWLLGVALHAAASYAQQVTTSITPSSTGSLGTAVAAPVGGVHDITGGTRSGPNQTGPNLFHSFGTFTIGPGDVANFVNDKGLATSNILGRVTGGLSEIYGTIRTNSASGFGSANLFLINPAGWVFGPSAVLEVGGSFHASTAHYLSFSPNERFYADPSEISVLSSADPVAFGFLGSPTGSISVLGSSLSVPDGKTLSLVGGNVQIGADLLDTGQTPMLSAPGGGRIQIGSFASVGEAAIDGLTGTFTSFGQIQISGFASISASGDFFGSTGGGSIIIRGGQLLVDASSINADTYGDLDGAPIQISMAESITLTNGAAIRTTASADFGFGIGRGGDIQVSAPDVSIDGSFVVAGTFGTGPGGNVAFNVDNLALTGGAGVGSLGGNVTIDARQSVSISGRDVLDTPSSLFTSTENNNNAGLLTLRTADLIMSDFGTITSSTLGGAGGDIVVEVDRLSMTGGANIESHGGSATARGGNVTLSVNQSAVIAGVGTDGSPSGIFANSCGGCADRAGDITVEAGTLSLTEGAQIKSGGGADPQGGNISATATTSMVISGSGGIATHSSLLDVGGVAISADNLVVDNGFISASTGGAGRGGDIAVDVQTLNLIRGGQIASSSDVGASGRGGDVTIIAESASISGTSPTGGAGTPFNTDPSSGIFSTARGSGDAGQIRIFTPSLTLADLGKIAVTTIRTGDAGTILANVGFFSINGGARVDSSTSGSGAGGAIEVNGALMISGAGSGLFSTASGTGNAGAIAVAGPALTLSDGGRISVATIGAGDAGTITANLGSFTITGGGRVDSSTTAVGAGGAIVVNGMLSIDGTGSGLFSTASSTGNAGAINVTGPTATLAAGGAIDSSTSGAGAGGAITVNGTASVSGTGSGLFSTASGDGNAGVINVAGPTLLVTNGGTIDSSASGAGAGGAIDISAATQVEISGGGSVRADSLGSGNTGSIKIAAGDRIVMEHGSVSTRAATSDGGNIELLAPNVIRLENSQVTTSVESGTGGGGNIFIDPQLVLMQGSSVTANAFGGPGGNITIVANSFVTDALTVVEASSALSTPGTVRIQSPDDNLAEAVAQLPKELVDASRLMQGACSARRAGAPSSFTVGGRGGVPSDPDGYLPSYSASAPVGARASNAFALAMAGWDCWRQQ